jgi:hypothetical protein
MVYTMVLLKIVDTDGLLEYHGIYHRVNAPLGTQDYYSILMLYCWPVTGNFKYLDLFAKNCKTNVIFRQLNVSIKLILSHIAFSQL